MDLMTLLEYVKDKETFLIFLDAMVKDKISNNDQWEHDQIEDYLEAIGAWIKDTDKELSDNSWREFAEMLYSGKIYE